MVTRIVTLSHFTQAVDGRIECPVCDSTVTEMHHVLCTGPASITYFDAGEPIVYSRTPPKAAKVGLTAELHCDQGHAFTLSIKHEPAVDAVCVTTERRRELPAELQSAEGGTE